MLESIAVLDLGSNSARISVFSIQDEAHFSLEEYAYEMIRLAGSITEDGTLSKDAFPRAAAAINRLCRLARQHHAVKFLCIATEAVRKAKNSDVFLAYLFQETGLSFEIISGEKEAQYGFFAAKEETGLTDFLLLDTGGASVEISTVRSGVPTHSISLPIGSLAMHRRWIHSDPVTASDFFHLQSHICKALTSVGWLFEGRNLPIAALGGTNKCAAKLDCPGLAAYQGYTMPAERIMEIYEKILSSSISERARLEGMEQGREDSILAGMTVAVTLINLLSSPEMVISEWGLGYGIFLEYWNKSLRKEERFT